MNKIDTFLNPRLLEKRLRDAGFSRREAKKMCRGLKLDGGAVEQDSQCDAEKAVEKTKDLLNRAEILALTIKE